jgi:hypothetical protein
MPTWRYVPLRDVHAAVGLAERLGVSAVARSNRGFLSAYERFGKAAFVEHAIDPYTGQLWGTRRAAFIARHLPQYDANPTLRRKIALLIWAFDVHGSRKKIVV